MWTWTNRNESSRSYLDRVFVRSTDRSSVSCPEVQIVGYTDQKPVTCAVKLERTNRRGPGYWKLKASFPARKDFRDRVSALVKRELTGAIINNRWWLSLKRKIKTLATSFSREIAIENSRVEDELVSRLEETHRGAIANDVLAARMALDHFFDVKHEGCVVRARVRALKHEGTKAAQGPGWRRHSVETNPQFGLCRTAAGARFQNRNRCVRLSSSTLPNCLRGATGWRRWTSMTNSTACRDSRAGTQSAAKSRSQPTKWRTC